MMYKLLPDVEMSWWDVAMGAFATAVLFTAGKTAIGLYLGNATVTSAYGAAGSLVVVLFWVYYSAMLVFLGAEFTQVWAMRHGSLARPKNGALPEHGQTLAPPPVADFPGS
jgi:membrane protein